MNQTIINIKDIIAPHFWNTFNKKITDQIYCGGRNSTKTSMIALKMVYNCVNNDNCSAVALRYNATDLRKSVYKEIKRACTRLGLVDGLDYKATVSPMEIKFDNGNSIYFAGGNDFEAVKGTIDEKKLIKLIWFEELTGFNDEDTIDQIKATFARGNNDWFITLYSFNPPKNKFDWVNKWIDKKRLEESVLVHHSDYRSVNPEWVGQKAIQEAERLKKYDEKRYNWIYLGEVIGIEGLVYNYDQMQMITEKEIEDKKLKVLYLDFCVDGGHQTSATTCACYGYLSSGNWCLLDTYYYSPNEKSVKKAPSELSRDIFKFEISMMKKYKSNTDRETIDSAEGALRNQLFKDYSKRFNPVNKGKNKQELIDYSQDFLSKGKFFVLDNPNNSIFLKEFKNYMYKDGSVEKGKPEPDKSEKELKSNEIYFNTHSNSYSYYYADHTCDVFQYWCKDNMQKLGLKY